MREDHFDVAYRLLDGELVDSEGRRCGRVDDAEITAILSGPGTWAQRLPRALWRPAARILGEDCVRVPWDAVRDIDEVISLKRRGEDLGLGRGDDSAGRVVRRIPGS